MDVQRFSRMDIASASAEHLMLTPHAVVRVQQRGVDCDVLDCLLRYGRREFDHSGCEIVVFDDESLDVLARYEPFRLFLKAAESRSLYAVVNSDGQVVTTGHRFRRVIRDKSISSFRIGRSRKPRILHHTNYRYRMI